METFTVEGQIREGRGKGPARRTRMTGMVPAVLYGASKESISLAVNAKQVARILRSETGHNTIFSVQIAGGTDEKAMLKDWQVDPVSGALLHVDLLRIAMDVRMRVMVPVHTFGEPQGVKMQGGVFETVTREVEIECLPGDIPEEFRMDVSDMLIGKQLRAGDLPLDPRKIKLLTDPTRVLAHVVMLKKEEEPAAEAAVAAEAAPAEPEVIKKGKKETEEGEGEGAPRPLRKWPRKRSKVPRLGCVRRLAAGSSAPMRFADEMRLIVGLGNPGRDYEWTPHNLGFLAVDALAGRAGIRDHAAGSESARGSRQSGRARSGAGQAADDDESERRVCANADRAVRGRAGRYDCAD